MVAGAASVFHLRVVGSERRSALSPAATWGWRRGNRGKRVEKERVRPPAGALAPRRLPLKEVDYSEVILVADRLGRGAAGREVPLGPAEGARGLSQPVNSTLRKIQEK